MFDLGWSELLVVAIVALIVIGPKELPGVLRGIGYWMGKIRSMASEFQGQFQEAMREAEMSDLKKQMDELTDTSFYTPEFDALGDLQSDTDKKSETKAAEADADAPKPSEGVSADSGKADAGTEGSSASAGSTSADPQGSADSAVAGADASPPEKSVAPAAAARSAVEVVPIAGAPAAAPATASDTAEPQAETKIADSDGRRTA